MRSVLVFLGVCLAAAVVPLIPPHMKGHAQAEKRCPAWPSIFEGKRLQPVPLSREEREFATNFPGQIAKFSDGRSSILVRRIIHPTRRLHSSAECMTGAGFSVSPRPLWCDSEGRLWGSFEATRRGVRLKVRERIYDEGVGSWSDVSAWYWTALLGRTRGPWWAVTVVEPR